MTQLTDTDKQHRLDFMAYVLASAEPWHKEHLGHLYQLWQDWNERYFEAQLFPPYILLSEPSNPRRLGDCGPVSGFGGKFQIRIRPSLLVGTHPCTKAGERYADGRTRFVEDVLLHETIHQYHQEITGKRDHGYSGHGTAFRNECNRIGAILGLEPVRTCKKRGKDQDRESCSYWPHAVRPEEYYLGAYRSPKNIHISLDVNLDENTSSNRLVTAWQHLTDEQKEQVTRLAESLLK